MEILLNFISLKLFTIFKFSERTFEELTIGKELSQCLDSYEMNSVENNYLRVQRLFNDKFDCANLDYFIDNHKFIEKLGAVSLTLFKLNGFLEQIKKNMSLIIKECTNWQREEYLRDIIFNDSLGKHMPEVLYWTFRSIDISLLYQPPESLQWNQIQSFIDYVEIREEQQLLKSYEKFWNWVVLGNACLSKGLVAKN